MSHSNSQNAAVNTEVAAEMRCIAYIANEDLTGFSLCSRVKVHEALAAVQAGESTAIQSPGYSADSFSCYAFHHSPTRPATKMAMPRPMTAAPTVG